MSDAESKAEPKSGPVHRFFTHRLPYFAYRTGEVIAPRLPLAIGLPITGAIGRASAYALPWRAKVVKRHQRRVRPDASDAVIRRATNEAFASYTRYWYEMFRLPRDAQRPLTRFTVEGFEHIEKGIADGKGVILALPHVGGWEYAGAWLTQQGLPPVVVVEPVEPPELFQLFERERKAMGMEIIPLGPDAAARCLKALADNRVLCLLCDRDIGGDGIEVDFLGERTTLPAGPAVFALRSGAPVLPTAVYFDGRSNSAVIAPPIPADRQGRLRDDVVRFTERLAQALEGLIRRAPEQWHMMQPNWPSDRGEPAHPAASTPGAVADAPAEAPDSQPMGH